MPKRAVFLDRDGTIIEDVGFVSRVEDVKLLPQAAQAIARLNEAGWAVVVVTNQSGVARGLHTEADVAATNERMMDLLKRQHARVDAIYYCPHLPEGKLPEYAVVCNCRKPRPGMILQAAQDLDLDLSQSMMIGDAPRDVQAGLAAGTRAILLTQSATRAERVPDACGQAPDLGAAVTEILSLTPAPAAEVAPPAPEPEPAPAPAAVEAPAPEPAAEIAPGPALPAEEPPREIPIHTAAAAFVPEPEPGERKSKSKRAKEAPATSEAPAPEPVAPSSTPAPEPAPAPAPPPACGRCGREVREADIAAGRAFGRDGVYLCEICAAAIAMKADTSAVALAKAEPKTAPAPRERVPARDPQTDEVLREVQDIKRALTFRQFSPWHVLGSVAQAMAIGGVVVGFTVGSPTLGLLWAIYFQLVALTLFVLGRM